MVNNLNETASFTVSVFCSELCQPFMTNITQDLGNNLRTALERLLINRLDHKEQIIDKFIGENQFCGAGSKYLLNEAYEQIRYQIGEHE